MYVRLLAFWIFAPGGVDALPFPSVSTNWQCKRQSRGWGKRPTYYTITYSCSGFAMEEEALCISMQLNRIARNVDVGATLRTLFIHAPPRPPASVQANKIPALPQGSTDFGFVEHTHVYSAVPEFCVSFAATCV